MAANVTLTDLRSLILETSQVMRRSVLLSSPNILSEGPNDPGIFRAVFLAGGPGSGKSFSAEVLFGLRVGDEDKKVFKPSLFTPEGLKMVNSDDLFEIGLANAGIDKSQLAAIEKEDPDLWDKVQDPDDPNSIRNLAKSKLDARRNHYADGRLGMIIDGTGRSPSKVAKLKEELEELGYKTTMIFVDTDLEVALQRNQQRSRVLPDNLVTKLWSEVQEAKAALSSLFGQDFHYINNNKYGPLDDEITKIASTFTRDQSQTPAAEDWLQSNNAQRPNSRSGGASRP